MGINHDSKNNLEKLLSNYLSLVARIVYKDLPTERQDENGNRIWHPQGYFYKKLVDDYNNRASEISYDDIEKWGNNRYHGFVHGFMVGFIAFLHAGYLHQPDLELTVQDDNSQYSPTALLYSCLFHDFVKGAYDIDFEHDKILQEYFPSCIPETFNHSCPFGEEIKCPLVVGDRIELMRYDDYLGWVDLNKLNKNIMHTYNKELTLFYDHMRKRLYKLFAERNSGWIHHHIEEPKKWDYGSIEGFPQRACFTDNIDAYCVNHFCPRDHMFYDTVCGIIPFRDIKDKPYYLPREHISLENLDRNHINEWVLGYDMNESKMHIYNDFLDNNHYVFDSKFIKQFLTVTSKFYDRILICTFKR